MKRVTSTTYLIGIIIALLIMLIATVNLLWKTQGEISQDTSELEDEKIVIELVHYFTVEDMEKYAEMYNSMQDEVEVVCYYAYSREELNETYELGAVTGELPDIAMADSSDMQSWISLGIFEDISDELADWDDLEQYHEVALANCMDSDGGIYALPNEVNCLALVVNVTILEAAGVEELPETWEEFEAVCEAVAAYDSSLYGFVMSAYGNEEGTYQYIPWLYSTGADYLSLGSEAAIESVSFLASLVENGYMSKEVINYIQTDAYNVFCEGNVAMAEIGSWKVETIDEDIDGAFEYVIIQLPYDEQPTTVLGGEVFGVCVGTEYVEECVEFLKFLGSMENNADWCLNNGALPVRADSRELYERWSETGEYAVFVESLDVAVCRGPDEFWPEISTIMIDSLQQALLGDGEIETIMAEAQASVDAIRNN